MSQAEHDQRVDYVELPAQDLAASKAFYQAVFGWEFTDWGPEYASFADGRLTGGLRLDPEPPGRGALVVIFAVDLEATRDRVVAAGGTLGALHEFPGGRRFHFTDPGGNELAVWSDR